jgi:hypothetical protein
MWLYRLIENCDIVILCAAKVEVISILLKNALHVEASQ